MYNDNNISNNNDENNSGNSNKGKFSERLKKIRRDRLKFKIKGRLDDEDDEFSLVDTGRNIFKVILALPSVVYTHLVDKDNDKKKLVKEIIELEKQVGVSSEDKRIKISKIKELNVKTLIEKKKYLLNKASVSKQYVSLDDELKKQKLQLEIVNLIKKKLVKSVNELEILQSELYVLKELTGDEVKLSECQEKIKEIKKLLSKIKSLKEKYDYLKDNVDFQYMLEYGDDLLIDKILELKNICSSDDIRATIDDYKILDEYKYLYLKIDKLQDDMYKLEEYKTKKAEELKARDIEFDIFKDKLYNVDVVNDSYNRFVSEQQNILNEIDKKVSLIDSHEEVSYRLKGFNRLLGNSFKYLGLLLLNPLKGLIPGIVTQTLITRNVIHNLSNNLELEESKRMVYEAIDYSVSIDAAINNLEKTSSLVDSTLEEIISLKKKYESEFSKYEGEFAIYKDAMKKLNKIENSILGSKIKIENIRLAMNENKKKNDNKLLRVKNLNSSNNS